MEKFLLVLHDGTEKYLTAKEIVTGYYNSLHKFGIRNNTKLLKRDKFNINFFYYNNFYSSYNGYHLIDGVTYNHYSYIYDPVHKYINYIVLHESFAVVYDGYGRPIDINDIIDIYLSTTRLKDSVFYKKPRKSKKYVYRLYKFVHTGFNNYRRGVLNLKDIDLDDPDEYVQHRIRIRNRKVNRLVPESYDNWYGDSFRIPKSWKNQSKRKHQWKETIDKY